MYDYRYKSVDWSTSSYLFGANLVYQVTKFMLVVGMGHDEPSFTTTLST